jgi:cell division protein FtsQ
MATFGNKRRRKDRYLLDVKVHTEARTRARFRWLAAWGAALLVCGFTSYGMYRLLKSGAGRLVFENPRFAIAQMVVETDGVLQPQQVMRFAGVQKGQNIFSVNLREVQRNLELIPMIKQVEIRRELPQRLVIRLNERTAVARLQPSSRQLKDEVFLIDREGVVMKPIRLDDGTVLQPQTPRVLPVLTGAGLADVRVGRPVESEQVQRALSLLDKLEQSGAGTMLEVEQIDLSKARRLTLVTRQRMTVQFDVQDLRPQLRRVSAILNWAQQHQRQVASIDLTVNRGVPVSFSGDAAATINPAGAGSAQPASLRRSH